MEGKKDGGTGEVESFRSNREVSCEEVESIHKLTPTRCNWRRSSLVTTGNLKLQYTLASTLINTHA